MDTKIIKMNVYNKDGFLSPYSDDDMPLISEEVADFFENQCLTYKTKNDLKIIMNIKDFDENNKNIYINAIHEYYKNRAEDYKYYIHRDLFLSILLLILALGVLMTNLFYYGENVAILEIIDIIAWSFTCEAVDKFCFERTKYVRKYKKAKSIMNAPIEFQKVENK